MFSEIIKSYQEEDCTKVIKEIYVECADHFQGRHYEKHSEFIKNTPAYFKSESLCEILDGMIGDNLELQKAFNKLLECITAIYSCIPDFYYICGLKDSANIKDYADIETHIEKMLVMHREKTYKKFGHSVKDYNKSISDFEMCKEQIVKELGEDARKVISDIEEAEHEANETATIIDYIGALFDAKLIRKFINEYPLH